MKEKVIIWGTGSSAEKKLCKIGNSLDCVEIIGFADNNSSKWGTYFHGYRVFSPSEIAHIAYDKIIIMSSYYSEISLRLQNEEKVPINKIEGENYILKLLLIKKYYTSKNPEIRDILTYLENNDLSVFNQYLSKKETFSRVFWDPDCSMSFIMFEGKRMYYPRKTKFETYKGNYVIRDILKEQEATSPHLYINSNHNIQQGDIVVDAGACEGNFALRYIEMVKKMYIFECDLEWVEALKQTFKPYKEKTVIISKKLGNCIAEDMTTLDQEIIENIDFLKMDIEGAETDALRGGESLLRRSNAKCSICSYHRENDEKEIKKIFFDIDYETKTSNGYMVFTYDENIYKTVDFRRGIVYASHLEEKNRNKLGNCETSSQF